MRAESGLKRIVAGMVMVGLLAMGPPDTRAGESGNPEVTVEGGTLAGTRADDLNVFRGIRYAAPPVGGLRWRPPLPPAAWDGVRVADAFGADCPQPSNPRWPQGEVERAEDCLYLNVWAPADSDRPLPVMVWLHGGAHRIGSGSLAYYNGAGLARRGAVVVTVNYRLGLLGYFAHPAINEGESGNYGLLDEMAALRWVRDNIAAFGGDPDNLTVFGQSAGAVDIQHLMVIDAARGLFDKAIIQSGGGWAVPKSRRGQRELVRDALASIDMDGAKADPLRNIPPEKLISGLSKADSGLGFGPFIDGHLVTRAPREAFAAGETAPVPMIVGSNDREGSLVSMVDLGPKQKALVNLPGVRALYKGQFDSNEALTELLFGDIGFVAPARWLAAQHVRDGAPAYLYHFTYVAESRREAVSGAAHGAEIPYVFVTLDAGPNVNRIATAADRELAGRVADCWVAFARTGAPECDLVAWHAYDPERDNTFVIGEVSGEREGFRARVLDAVTRFFGPGARGR